MGKMTSMKGFFLLLHIHSFFQSSMAEPKKFGTQKIEAKESINRLREVAKKFLQFSSDQNRITTVDAPVSLLAFKGKLSKKA